jgi:paraquat-inducible protein A
MAIATAFTLLLVPATQIILLLWVLMYARLSQRAPGFRQVMLALTALRSWNMLEVFLLGAVIAIVKLTGRLEALPAVGLFALGGLSLLLIGITGRDLPLLWEKLP